jgi:hypothetical protein
MKWLWKGPLEGGITQSLIQKFLQDPFIFVIYYGLGLEEPEQHNQNLLWGNVMHKGLEIGLSRPEPIKDILPEIRGELVHEVKKYPYINASTIESVCEMLKLYDDKFKHTLEHIITEKQFKIKHQTRDNTVSLMGKLDLLGVSLETGHNVLGEHKCKGSYDKQLFRQEYHTDLQLNIYCFATKTYDIIYDNILIPETQWNCPARDMNERIEFWIHRLYHKQIYGSYPVAKKSFAWLDQLSCSIPPEEVRRYFDETVNPIIDRICDLYDYCSQPNFDPLKQECFNKLFYKNPLRLFDPARTDKYKRNNWTYLVGQITHDQLSPVGELFKELQGEG